MRSDRDETMQQWPPDSAAAMTFDEVSMERSKSFVKALQELKNLRPQLYSAAEYCERSYLHSEQKQMVLDNLKDYAVRALVNAVDHLGTVAYKLTDLFEQQMLDISTVDMKIECLNQRTLTCQAYVDKGGLDQLRMSIRTMRHHKHYILPNSATQTLQSSSHDNMHRITGRPNSHEPGKFVSKTLSWHIASEPNSAPNVAPSGASSIRDKTYNVNSPAFHLLVAEEPAASLPFSDHHRALSGNAADMTSSTVGLMGPPQALRSVSLFKSIDSPGKREISRDPARSKSMLSGFFTKNKTFRQRKLSVS